MDGEWFPVLWKNISCIVGSVSASGIGSEVEASEGLSDGPESGGFGCDIESNQHNQHSITGNFLCDILRLTRGGATLLVKVASSNGRHLKSFL
jgi:hypothetical protein